LDPEIRLFQERQTHLQLHKKWVVRRLRMRTKTWSERMATSFLLLGASSSILTRIWWSGDGDESSGAVAESEERLWRCVHELINNQMEASFVLK
jgi:hypothetical protein